MIEDDPQEHGEEIADWTTILLADYVGKHTAVRVDPETVRRQPHRLGYVCKRPTWTVGPKAAKSLGIPAPEDGLPTPLPPAQPAAASPVSVTEEKTPLAATAPRVFDWHALDEPNPWEQVPSDVDELERLLPERAFTSRTK